jgi:hypothetical protein
MYDPSPPFVKRCYVTINDVNMQQIGASSFNFADLFSKARTISGEDGGDNRYHAVSPSSGV